MRRRINAIDIDDDTVAINENFNTRISNMKMKKMKICKDFDTGNETNR